MKFQTQLSQAISRDDVIDSLPEVNIYHSAKDRNHLSRRLQQRAINWDAIRIAIAYGNFQYFSQAQTWTLLDRSLVHSPYARFIDKLRGLRIIANNYTCGDTIELITAYWVYDLRR
jgi:hypothetical protein